MLQWHTRNSTLLCVLRCCVLRCWQASAMRTVISIHLAAGDSLVGRLRLRASQLRPATLQGPVTLPLLGDRAQSKGPTATATATLSLMVSSVLSTHATRYTYLYICILASFRLMVVS
jgi:hypothetical protein